MKTRIFGLLSALAISMSVMSACAQKPVEKEYVVVAYVTSWKNIPVDPTVMTHINYAFGHVNDTFDGVRIDNPRRLKSIVDLKTINPDLTGMLSVGGWGSGGFSEMAADLMESTSTGSTLQAIRQAFLPRLPTGRTATS